MVSVAQLVKASDCYRSPFGLGNREIGSSSLPGDGFLFCICFPLCISIPQVTPFKKVCQSFALLAPTILFDALLDRWKTIRTELLWWPTAAQAAVKFEAVYHNLS